MDVRTLAFLGDYIFSIGAIIFTIFQSLIIIDFAYETCQRIVDRCEDNPGRKFKTIVVTGVIGSIALNIIVIGFLIGAFARKSCTKSLVIASIQLALCLVIYGVSISTEVQEANPLSDPSSSSIVSLYSTYLLFVSLLLQDESGPEKCNIFKSQITKYPSFGVFGSIFTLISLIYSSVYASSIITLTIPSSDLSVPLLEDQRESGQDRLPDSSFLAFLKGHERKGVLTSYTLFHLLMACSSIYVCRSVVNWKTLIINDGIINVEGSHMFLNLRIGAAWGTILIFLWTSISPLVLREDF